DIWDRQGALDFVTELRSVDPDVTGTPIITFEAIRLMERSYKEGTVYAVLLVSLVTSLTLRRARETVLALLPLGLGMLWTFGLMYFFDLQFNMGNVFGLPLILGAAAEYGLNVVMRYMEGRDHGGPLIARSTVMGVLVSGLSTIVGFGSLMVADHRGIFGLGLLLTLGTATSLVAAACAHPTPAGALGALRRRGVATPPYAIVFSDYTVHRQWLHPEADVHYVPADALRPAVVAGGVAAERVVTAGIPLRPEFAE